MENIFFEKKFILLKGKDFKNMKFLPYKALNKS